MPPATLRVGRLLYYKNPEKIIFIIGVIRDLQKLGVKIDEIKKITGNIDD